MKKKLLIVSLLIVIAFCLLLNLNTSVDERLAIFIDCQIAAHHQSLYTKDNFSCLDWEVIGKETKGNQTTIYMWVLYEEYSYEEKLITEAGAHILTAITVEKKDYNYQLVEYWEPKDGSYYTDSIKEKVPFYLWGKALDSQRYIDKQSAALEKLAKEHFAKERIDRHNHYDADGNLTDYIVREYDEDMHCVKESYYKADDTLTHYYIKEYTPDGTWLKSTRYDAEGNIMES